jgi:hypothetical protein
MKNCSTEGADWVVMKTPIGNLFFAFPMSWRVKKAYDL